MQLPPTVMTLGARANMGYPTTEYPEYPDSCHTVTFATRPLLFRTVCSSIYFRIDTVSNLSHTVRSTASLQRSTGTRMSLSAAVSPPIHRASSSHIRWPQHLFCPRPLRPLLNRTSLFDSSIFLSSSPYDFPARLLLSLTTSTSYRPPSTPSTHHTNNSLLSRLCGVAGPPTATSPFLLTPSFSITLDLFTLYHLPSEALGHRLLHHRLRLEIS